MKENGTILNNETISTIEEKKKAWIWILFAIWTKIVALRNLYGLKKCWLFDEYDDSFSQKIYFIKKKPKQWPKCAYIAIPKKRNERNKMLWHDFAWNDTIQMVGRCRCYWFTMSVVRMYWILNLVTLIYAFYKCVTRTRTTRKYFKWLIIFESQLIEKYWSFCIAFLFY